MSKNTGILHTSVYTAEELDRMIINTKRRDDAVRMRVSDIESINFNKLTMRTTIVYKVLKEYAGFFQVSTRTTRKSATVTSSKKDFVDYRVGFLLAYLKDKGKISEKRQHALYNEVFKSGKPRITFLRGFAVHFFNSFREMDRILEAIKEEKSQVNINGNVIQITWKG